MRGIHAEFGAIGTPLEAVGSGRGIELLDDGSPAEVRDLAAEILRTRVNGSRLLDAVEWQRIEAIDGSDGPETLQMLQTFARSRRATPNLAGRHRIVIDLRPLQSGTVNGTVTHARAITAAVFEALSTDRVVEALVDPTRALPDAAVTAHVGGVHDPADAHEVAVFIETSPLEDKRATIALDADPAIRRVGVWLDAIIGAHPEHYLPTAAQVFGYQYSLECVGVLDEVLALSDCSRDEVIALGVPADRVVVTGCRSSLIGTAPATEPLPFARSIVIAGNMAPHKDLLTALIGLSAVLAREPRVGVVVLATPTADQHEAVGHLLDRAGIARDRVRFESQVSTERMVQLIAAADLVVVASQHEGFSLPVVESIALDTPVVVSDIVAHRELLGEGSWMFAAGDPVALSGAVQAARRDLEGLLTRERGALADRYDADRLATVVSDVVSGEIGRIPAV